MKVHIGVDKVEYADAGYQRIEMRAEFEGKDIDFRVAMRPGKHRAQPEMPEGRVDDLIEIAKAHIGAKVEHPYHLISVSSAFRRPGSGA